MASKMKTLVGSYEISLLLGVSKPRVHQIINAPGTGRIPPFPEPVVVLHMGQIWALDDVQRWAAAASRTLVPVDEIGIS